MTTLLLAFVCLHVIAAATSVEVLGTSQQGFTFSMNCKVKKNKPEAILLLVWEVIDSVKEFSCCFFYILSYQSFHLRILNSF